MAKVFRRSETKLLFEFFRYCMVGGTAFLFDYTVLFLLTEFLQVYYLLSSILGFIAGVTVNYYLSKWWVFTNSQTEGFQSFMIFTGIGVIGLGMTVSGMWLGVEILRLNYMLVKVAVTGLVLVWNYLARRKMVFGRIRYESN